MTKQHSWLIWAAAAMLSATAPAMGEETRGVVELFTSQGCSSCPAADKLMGELARDPSLVIMSAPIDYWDYLGWRDTLAKPRHSARQRGYAKLRGDRDVYTPQAVINGAAHVLGSDRAAIEQAVSATRTSPGTLTLPVSFHLADGQLQVRIGEGKAMQGGEVWLCALTREVPVVIGRGENSGRTLTYYNVIRRWVKLGDWNGAARAFTLPRRELIAEGADAVAVIIQSGTVERPGPLLGAATTAMR